jgi:hypothetical protein
MRPTLLLILFLATLSTQAQITPGIKLGANFARYRLQDQRSPYTTRIGINTGIVARMPVGNRFFLQSDLMYTEKGHRYPEGSVLQGTNKLNYVALDVLAGFKIANKFHVMAGPEVGRLVKQEYEFDNGTFGPDRQYRDWDLGINGGVSFFATRSLAVEGRYQHGLLKTYEVIIQDQFGNVLGSKMIGTNRVFQLNVVYFLSRRKK